MEDMILPEAAEEGGQRFGMLAEPALPIDRRDPGLWLFFFLGTAAAMDVDGAASAPWAGGAITETASTAGA